MRPHLTLITLLCLCLCLTATAQKDSIIRLKTGPISIKTHIHNADIGSFNRTATRLNNKTLVYLQFSSIPQETQRNQLAAKGITLHGPVAQNVYTATITGNTDASTLINNKITSFIQLSPLQKTDPLLKGNSLPAWAIKVPGTIDITISFPSSFLFEEVAQYLKEKNIDIVSGKWASFGKITVRITPARITELASFPFIEYIEPTEPPLELFNHKSRQGSRANILSASVADGGLGLNGEGVTIGIGDNTAINTHIDFTGRLIERNTALASHGIHVAGTAAGGGIINELFRGYAPKAQIVNALQDNIVSGVFMHDYNMVITNNSYGAPFSCTYNGQYMYLSSVIDELAIRHPALINVYGAGNYGNNSCPPYPHGYNTVSTLWQSAKNTIAVGATSDSAFIAPASSRGPTMDGRIKPEIVAMGRQVTSAWPTNIYSFNSGTSMSAPAVAGALALLYQRYRQLHGGADPINGLMKALLCNGATDKGNPGPDYLYGFGFMNVLRSVEMLNKQQYVVASAAQNTVATHSISVPAGTAQLKVMLYWNDPGAMPLATKALVNDLDLEIVTPNSSVVLPLILDPTPANVNRPAVNGVDTLNNIEQAVIDLPAAGNYTIKVKGSAIAQGPSQQYFLVYDVIPVSLTLTSPAGGDALVPGETVKVAWDAYGNSDKTFDLQFSPDNGTTWTDIATNLEPARRIYSWKVPDVATTTALIRVVQNNTSFSSTSRPLTIIGLPVVSLSPVQCETYIAINWTPANGADHYEVMMLKGDAMEVVATTSSLQHKFINLSKENIYWVAVRPIINGKPGRRAVAVSRKPNTGNCVGDISDNDLIVDALVSPATGRRHTSTALKTDNPVVVRIKNLDDAPVHGFTVSYAINNGQWISETVNTTIAAGAAHEHRFATTEDLSAAGNYQVTVVVKNNTPDAAASNDTLALTVRHLNNQPLDLSNVFTDSLESAESKAYLRAVTGLSGADRYDFQSTLNSGVLSTFLNTGFASSGAKAFIMGETERHNVMGLNYVTGTFNLSNYNVASNALRADFMQLNTHFATPNDAFWIRGADDMPWIRMGGVARTDTNYRRSLSFAITDSLAAHGQEFSSSFQMQWGQSSFFQSLGKSRMYAIDDIRLYQVFNDVQMIRIDTPGIMSCAINGNVPVKIGLYNTHSASLTNVPVKYSINNGAWVEEIIPSIPAKSTMQYTFARQLDMSAHATYKLVAVVAYPADNYRDNDTVRVDIQNSIFVSSYPYLQNFEHDRNGWYTAGQNSSWEYGTPASEKINGAASGAKAWKTSLAGSYNSNERSYLYTPCFDLNNLANPALSFSMAIDMEECSVPPCDGVWLEYTTNGVNWLRIGNAFSGYNWYNDMSTIAWNGARTRWRAATVPLSPSMGVVRFRFVMAGTNPLHREGFAVDDFHVYEYLPIHDSTIITPVTQSISGGGWTDLKRNDKLVASVLPHNQASGNADAQLYIHEGDVRSTSTQYYHNRNLVMRSPVFNDSVTVRFYFTDAEATTLLDAAGCAACTRPLNAYRLGVSIYNDADNNNENGTIADNRSGVWSFIPWWKLSIVPFDNGYYAEFKTKDPAECWLNNGGPDHDAHLAIQLLEFSAQRAGKRDVVLNWKMGSEEGIARYEIERSRNGAAMRNGLFEKIGQLMAGAPAPYSYAFTDTDQDKFDTLYYRLKMVYSDGRFAYSTSRQVIFEEAVPWNIYPNPSAGVFYLDYPGNANETVFISLFDAKGSLIRSFRKQGGGFMQKVVIDLSAGVYPKGIYMLRLNMGSTSRSFRLYKQ